MTAARLAAKMRKLREDHEDEEMENGELNLVPYLDIVTNVIMFLMMTTTLPRRSPTSTCRPRPRA